MKFLKHSVTLFLLSLLTLGISAELQAQDDNYSKAIAAFNKALDQAKSNEFESAINMYNQAISLAEQSENENASDIIERTRNQLPSIYFQLAVSRYKEFQKSKSMAGLQNALDSFQEASEMSEEFGDGQIAQKAGNIVTQLYYTKSILEYKSQNFDAALASLDQAIQRNANYAKAYYQKGIVIKNREGGDLEEALSMFDQAIEVGQKPAVSDQQIVRQATTAAHDELVYRGVQAMENKNFDQSIDMLNRALNYNSESADAHYRLAEVYNKRASWQQAISHAQQALEYETGGKTELAKIYFELGTAYKAEGQKANACSAFKNAAFGSFKSPAEHQMEFELECESSTR